MSKYIYIFVFLALSFMGIMMVHSAKDDTVTTDETLMIGVGDLILKEQYYKIGFEHPPLMRDIVAFPLLFMDLAPASHFFNVDSGKDLSAYAFNFGEDFIYGQKVAPEKILLAARLPAILITLLLGFCLFAFSLKYFNLETAFLALAFYISSPFFLAHGRFTTMDVPTAAFSFFALWAMIRLLQNMSFKNSSLLGLALGAALLIKFPMASLVPFLVLVYFSHLFLTRGKINLYLKHFGIVFLISFALVYAFYFYHIWAYPLAEHVADIKQNLQTTRPEIYSRLGWIISLAGSEFTRPIAHYFYGMNWQMLRGGAFGFFMGEGSLHAWPSYYPLAFLIKNPASFVLLFFITFGFMGVRLTHVFLKKKFVAREALVKNYPKIILFIWVIYYLVILIFLNSGNTGSRYLMPTLPAIFVLISVAMVAIYQRANVKIKSKLIIIFSALIGWQFISVYRVHPSYLSYFSEFLGSSAERGSKFLVDTDVEWGQDVKRLSEWVAERGIQQIAVSTQFDYFESAHGVNPIHMNFSDAIYRYYLKDRFAVYDPSAPLSGWLAVPARLLRWGQTAAAKNAGWSSSSYDFLNKYKPDHIVGGSIYVYHFN